MGGKSPRSVWAVLVLLVAACSTATAPRTADGVALTSEQVDSLSSLEQIDDHPLYVMHHYAPEPLVAQRQRRESDGDTSRPGWGCSLFAALADPNSRVFGRNFDWDFSPALLLFNHPDDGYESVAMVDIEYLGYPGDASRGLVDSPLSDLTGLLEAHRIPFDGMNEVGLAVAMAAVPATQVPSDPSKETVDSLGAIRVALDTAATVREAVDVFRSVNIDFAGQVPLHYLLADATGDAAVVEFDAGEMRVLRDDAGWLHMTNFLLSHVDAPEGHCDRYDTISAELDVAGGELDLEGALGILEQVAQPHTQWSIAYDMSTGRARVAMGQSFDRVHDVELDMR